MLIPIVGTQNVTTVGWSTSHSTKAYPLFLITLAAFITFATIGYAVYCEHISEGGEARVDEISAKEMAVDSSGRLVMPRTAMGAFDASDPVHLVVASAAPRLAPESQAERTESYWKQYQENVISLRLDK